MRRRILRVSNEPCADMETESCCVLARKQIEVYMDAYGECRDSERKAQRFSAVRSRACRHGELRSFGVIADACLHVIRLRFYIHTANAAVRIIAEDFL